MDLTRRGALALGAGLVLGGCTSGSTARPDPVDPDVALAELARVREQTLLDAYAAAALAHPQLASRLTVLRAEHEVHLAAVATSAPSPPASPAVSSAVSLVAPPVVDSPSARLAALRNLETAMSRSHALAAVTASRTLAPVLASLAACEASHAAVL